MDKLRGLSRDAQKSLEQLLWVMIIERPGNFLFLFFVVLGGGVSLRGGTKEATLHKGGVNGTDMIYGMMSSELYH